MITLKNIQKEIKHKVVLKNINIKFMEGKMYLIEGHNGCGKTMLLRMICGLIKPTQGNIMHEKNYSFGAIIENPSFIDSMSGLENLKFLAKINRTITEETILSFMRILRLYENRKEKVKSYSLGMKQRLAICQALMENPDVILLDEPFNALDEENYLNVIDMLNKINGHNHIIILAAHNIDKKHLLHIDQTIHMENGEIMPCKDNKHEGY